MARAAASGFSASNYLHYAGAMGGTIPFMWTAWAFVPTGTGGSQVLVELSDNTVNNYRTAHWNTTSSGTWGTGSVVGGSSQGTALRAFSEISWQPIASAFFTTPSAGKASGVGTLWSGVSSGNGPASAPTVTNLGYHVAPGGGAWVAGGFCELALWDLTGLSEAEYKGLQTALFTDQGGGIYLQAPSVDAQSGQPHAGTLRAYIDLDVNSPTFGQDLTGNGHDFTEVGTITAYSGGYPPVEETAVSGIVPIMVQHNGG